MTIAPLVITLALLASYLMGSVPFGLLLARKLRGVDVRLEGSGNIGATNVTRLLGLRLGAVTLLLDALKGLVPVVLMAWVVLPMAAPMCQGGSWLDSGLADGLCGWLTAASGALSFAGHCFPIWLRFRGGKGVATSLGVMTAMAPLAALAGVLCYASILAVFRISAVASLLAVTISVPVAFVTAGAAPGVVAGSMAVVIAIRHRENIRQLRTGGRASPGSTDRS